MGDRKIKTKLVADTNILFSFFLNNSFTRKFLLNAKIKIISPIKALKELKKYSELIIKKTGLNNKIFKIELNNLKKIVEFKNENDYSSYLNEAEKISPDKDGASFLALSLKYNCFLWSNDFKLKSQNKVKVLSTKEIIELFF